GLDLRQTPWDGRDAAQDDVCATADPVLHFEHDGCAHYRVRPRLAIQHLVIGAPRAGASGRQVDLGQQLVLREYVFPRRIDPRQREKLARGYRAFARRTSHAKLCFERDQCRGGVRWMDDVTRATAENRMKLVFTVGAVADVAAVLETRKAVAIVPAPGPLA